MGHHPETAAPAPEPATPTGQAPSRRGAQGLTDRRKAWGAKWGALLSAAAAELRRERESSTAAGE